MNWLAQQWEWFKLFFAEDKALSAPSHKNLIGILMVIYFGIGYLKNVYYQIVSQTGHDVPDIPAGWQLVILGVLGIRALQSAAEKISDAKYGNGNGQEEEKLPNT